MNSCQECYHRKIASAYSFSSIATVESEEVNALLMFLAELYQVVSVDALLMDFFSPSLFLL